MAEKRANAEDTFHSDIKENIINKKSAKEDKKKKAKTNINYPPYINSCGKIDTFFEKIKTAQAPTKFTPDFLKTVLGFTSSYDTAFISLLKKLKFLDEANQPTARYNEFRVNSKSKGVMAKAFRELYSDLYQVNEYADRLNDTELKDLLKQRTGAADNDRTLSAVMGTFNHLKKFADFSEMPSTENKSEKEEKVDKPKGEERSDYKFGISYTINLNLPPTTDIEVFNAIFKSLKENLMKDG